MYHYAGNNPVRYVDPDGRTIFIEGDKQKTLDAINKYSHSQYGINKDGYLFKTDKVNKKGSKLYSESIDRCINDSNSEIVVCYSTNGVNYVYGIEFNIKSYGGGATFFDPNEKDPSEIYVFFMKKGKSDIKRWNVPREQVLMHEIVGHADPISSGGTRDKENAVANENKVLDQLGLSKKRRVEKTWHTAR